LEKYVFLSLIYGFLSKKYIFPSLIYIFPSLIYIFPSLIYIFPSLIYGFPSLIYGFPSEKYIFLSFAQLKGASSIGACFLLLGFGTLPAARPAQQGLDFGPQARDGFWVVRVAVSGGLFQVRGAQMLPQRRQRRLHVADTLCDLRTGRFFVQEADDVKEMPEGIFGQRFGLVVGLVVHSRTSGAMSAR